MTCASCVNRIERFLRKTRGRRGGDGQPRHRDGDDPLPARRRRRDGPRRRRSRPRATTCKPPPTARTRRPRRTLLAGAVGGRRRPRARGAVAAAPGRGLDRGRRRDHGRDVRAPDARPDGDDQLARPRARRRSSRSGPAGASTARPGGPPATARRNMDTLVAVGTTRGLAVQRRRDALPGRRSTRPACTPRPTSTPRRSSSASSCSGRWLEARARTGTTGAIRRLVGLQADDRPARRPTAATADVPLEAVVVGDLLRVRPGEKVPVDGVVVEGASAVEPAC